MRRRRKDAAVSAEPVTLSVDSVELEGRGVGRREGKVAFVRGALPGENVSALRVRAKPRFDVYETDRVLRPSADRVQPECPHFGVCGGCSMQHAQPRAQVAYKQRALEDTLNHLGGVRPALLMPPIEGPAWGYRHRARLTVRRVVKKGGVLVGFHEKASSYVADMRVCRVLPPRMSGLLVPLRDLVESLSIRERLPQIEVAIGDDGQREHADGLLIALVFRVLEPPTPLDIQALRQFGRQHGTAMWLQSKGPETIVPLPEDAVSVAEPDAEPVAETDAALAAERLRLQLSYELPAFGLRIPFSPTEFTQVNAAVNRSLVSRTLDLLDVQPDDAVLDLFCGLGNFTLPLAVRSRSVHGIEGSAALVRRAEQNARFNQDRLMGAVGAADGLRFSVADLFTFDENAWQALGRVDRVLIDPPRDGAMAVATTLAHTATPPQRIVYVSCNPATLARDAAILVNEGGWTLDKAGIVNMFPQTSHVESIAVFSPPAAGSAESGHRRGETGETDEAGESEHTMQNARR